VEYRRRHHHLERRPAGGPHRTHSGTLQVLKLLAKLNREIGARADEAPAVRIVIGGNIPLDGMAQQVEYRRAAETNASRSWSPLGPATS